jgi:hypothetical protein
MFPDTQRADRYQEHHEPGPVSSRLDGSPVIIVLGPNGKPVFAIRITLEYMELSLDAVQSDNFRNRICHPGPGDRAAISGLLRQTPESKMRKLSDTRYRYKAL